jgi:hypothetical protein
LIVKNGPANVNFVRFLSEFWDYEKSPYVREKLAQPWGWPAPRFSGRSFPSLSGGHKDDQTT